MKILGESPAPGSVLEIAEAYFRDEIAPIANQMDTSEALLAKALQGLGERGLLSLRRPAEYGGPALGEVEFRQFQQLVARYSGALSFLQTQHQTAVSMLGRSENAELKQRILPKCHSGDETMGIAFAHLRRPGPPLLTASTVDGGYEISGHIPWATGYGYYKRLLLGAVLEDGRIVFCLAPFGVDGQLEASEPMKLAAMQSARTVTMEAKQLFVPSQDVVLTMDRDWIFKNDLINIALQGHYAIGCARGSLDLLAAVAEKKSNPAVQAAYKALSQELNDVNSAIGVAMQDASQETTQARLDARAWAIEFAVRAAQATIAATGGSANSLAHPAQRLYREALVYTVSAQTQPIMEATLRRLVR